MRLNFTHSQSVNLAQLEARASRLAQRIDFGRLIRVRVLPGPTCLCYAQAAQCHPVKSWHSQL
jgi:hypothetical protein